MNKKKIFLIAISIFTFFLCNKVNAEKIKITTGENGICNNGYMYVLDNGYSIDGLKYYSRLGKNGFNLITTDNNKHGYSEEGISFTYQLLSGARACYNTVTGTPSSYKFTAHTCNEKYINQISLNNNKTSTEQTFDPNTGTITLKLTVTGALANQMSRLRVVRNYNGGSAGSVRKSGNQIIISGITPSTVGKDSKYTIDFYLDDVTASDFIGGNNSVDAVELCTNNRSLFITYIDTNIMSASSIEMNIPESFRNSSLCKNVKKYQYASEEFKNTYIPECYNEKYKVMYEEYLKLSSTVTEKYNTLINMFPKPNPGTLINTKNLKCTSPDLGIISEKSSSKAFDKKVTYEKNFKYWGIVCTESYYVEADSPALVRAGQGVKYDNRVEIVRTCNVVNIYKPTLKEKCVADAHIGCDHQDGVFDLNAGPNAKFDGCVLSCDNGEYTQECINKCYKEIYQDDFKTSNLFKNMNTVFSDYVAKRLSANGHKDTDTETYISPTDGGTHAACNGYSIEVGDLQNQCNPNHPELCGRSKNVVLKDPSGNSVETANVAWQCSTDANTCRVQCSVGPAGCVDDPKGEYDKEIAASKKEYDRIKNILLSYDYISPIKNYTMTFTDTDDGQKYIVSGSTTTKIENGPSLNIKQDSIKIKQGDSVQIVIGTQGDQIKEPVTFTSNVVYGISLPKQYTLKSDPSLILVESNGKLYERKNNKSGTYSFKEYTKVGINSKLLSTGENVYYTSLKTDDYNRKVECEKVNATSIKNASTNPNTLLGMISKITELKNELGEVVSKNKFDQYWLGNSDYLNAYSLNAYVAYIQQSNLIVKSLIEEYDNIEVSFQIGTFGDVYKDGGVIHNHSESGYKCYYGVYNMLQNNGDCGTPGGLRYYYHEINPEKIFDKREPRWNWTGTITPTGTTGAATIVNKNYFVDPVRLIQYIENKGNTIYTDKATQDTEMDYHYTLDNATIHKIRSYNKTKVDGKKISYTQFSLADAKNSFGENYSLKVREWLGDAFNQKAMAISPCNNSLANSCYNYKLGGK